MTDLGFPADGDFATAAAGWTGGELHRRGAQGRRRVRGRAHPGVDPQRGADARLPVLAGPRGRELHAWTAPRTPTGSSRCRSCSTTPTPPTYTDIGELITELRGPDRAAVVTEPDQPHRGAPAPRRARGHGPLRWGGRPRRALLRHPRGRHLRADRPQRGRQDHVLQRGQPALRAHAGPRACSTARTSSRLPPHRIAERRDRPHVPEPRPVPVDDAPRERHGRGPQPGLGRLRAGGPAAAALGRGAGDPGTGLRAARASSASPSTRSVPRPACPSAPSSGSSWPAPSPPGRGSCCSTSRRRASPTARSTSSGRRSGGSGTTSGSPCCSSSTTWPS